MSEIIDYDNNDNDAITQSLFGQMMKTPERDDMVKNNAGGYVFPVSDETAITRYCILGTTDGSYYASQSQMDDDMFNIFKKMIGQGKSETIFKIASEIYLDNRAPKPENSLKLISYLDKNTEPGRDKIVRQHIAEFIPKIRIGTHLYTFTKFHVAGETKGWGRRIKNAYINWFSSRDAQPLAYQLYKYAQRDSWSALDLIRLCHVNPTLLTSDQQLVIKSVAKGLQETLETTGNEQIRSYLSLIHRLKTVTDDEFKQNIQSFVDIIRANKIPREFLQTWMLNYTDIWLALLLDKENKNIIMPITALIRNLGVMSSKDIFIDNNIANMVAQHLKNKNVISKGHVHPVQFLIAERTYAMGHGDKGSLTWAVNPTIRQALEDAFYISFGTIEPTGKRIFHAIDGSGSMTMQMSCLPCMTSCEAVTTLAMVFSRTESSETQTFALFSSQNQYNSKYTSHNSRLGSNIGFKKISITPDSRLSDATEITRLSDFGNTDCSLPMLKAIEEYNESNGEKGKYDAFIVYTDNETWAGHVKPSIALQKYRAITNIPAKLIVVATTATKYSIADPTDNGMLDIVGFDTNAPRIIHDFLL